MNKIHLFVYVYESEEHLPWSHNLKLDSNVYAALHMSVFFFFLRVGFLVLMLIYCSLLCPHTPKVRPHVQIFLLLLQKFSFFFQFKLLVSRVHTFCFYALAFLQNAAVKKVHTSWV